MVRDRRRVTVRRSVLGRGLVSPAGSDTSGDIRVFQLPAPAGAPAGARACVQIKPGALDEARKKTPRPHPGINYQGIALGINDPTAADAV